MDRGRQSSEAGLPDNAAWEELVEGKRNSLWGVSEALSKARFGMGTQELNFPKTHFCGFWNHIALNSTHSSTHIDWRKI